MIIPFSLAFPHECTVGFSEGFRTSDIAYRLNARIHESLCHLFITPVIKETC